MHVAGLEGVAPRCPHVSTLWSAPQASLFMLNPMRPCRTSSTTTMLEKSGKHQTCDDGPDLGLLQRIDGSRRQQVVRVRVRSLPSEPAVRLQAEAEHRAVPRQREAVRLAAAHRPDRARFEGSDDRRPLHETLSDGRALQQQGHKVLKQGQKLEFFKSRKGPIGLCSRELEILTSISRPNWPRWLTPNAATRPLSATTKLPYAAAEIPTALKTRLPLFPAANPQGHKHRCHVVLLG